MKVEIKICGLTNEDDARMALAVGADYLGFVLYSKSPRGIDATRLRQILDRLQTPCRAVAVVVNESRDFVERLAADCGLWAVQVHGDEKPDDFVGCPVRLWRAVRVGMQEAPRGTGILPVSGTDREIQGTQAEMPVPRGSEDPGPQDRICLDWAVERYVIDAAVPGMYGGTNVTADWTRAADLARRFPVMLAGGLTPSNVAAAITAVRPMGVDVASGVEAEPGRKDPVKVKEFVEAVRGVGA